MKRKYDKLTDGDIAAMREFDKFRGVIWDTDTRGLRVTLGVHRVTFAYFVERQFRGKRQAIHKHIGHWPRMTVADARKEALQHAARVAAGHPMPGRKDALTLDAAWLEYHGHLAAQAERRGKAATWARTAMSLVTIHLLPRFGSWSLIELSNAPQAVRDWHRDVSKVAPVSANRCASLLSATYRYAARLDRSLPPASPISAIRMNKETPKQSAMAFDQFPAWAEAVAKLSPIKQAFYRTALLTGCRSGELQRLEWSDVDWKRRSITIKHAKAGADIVLPMSAAIAHELNRARDVGHEGLIFPGARKWSDEIVRGHALRHSWRSVAADLGIEEIQCRMLLGHSLTGVNQAYITRLVLSGGPGLRAAQATISRRIVGLLGQA